MNFTRLKMTAVTIAALAPLSLLAGCSKDDHKVVTMPYCGGSLFPPVGKANLCMYSVRIDPRANDELAGEIRIETRLRPRTLHVDAFLEWWGKPSSPSAPPGKIWIVQDEKIYTLSDIPKSG